MGSPATPEQVANAMLFLASDESAAVTGHSLVADRGISAQDPGVCGARSEQSVRAALQKQGITTWIDGEK